MIIVAKFASVCPCCSNRIASGEKVEWSKGQKARHLQCARQPGAATSSTYTGTGRRPAGPTGARRYNHAPGAGAAAAVAGYSSWCTARPGCGCYDCAS